MGKKIEKIVKRLFGGEKGAEAILQRLDRLTSDEARITAAQTFEVVCGLFQNMRVVMDGEQIVYIYRALSIEKPCFRRQGNDRPCHENTRYVFSAMIKRVRV